MIGSAVPPQGDDAKARTDAVWQVGYRIANRGWNFRSGACGGLCEVALNGFDRGRLNVESRGSAAGIATGVAAVARSDVFTRQGRANPNKHMDVVLLTGEAEESKFGHPLGLLSRSIPLLRDADGVIVGAGRWGTRAEIDIARYKPAKGTFRPLHVVAVEDSGQLAGSLRVLDKSHAVRERGRWGAFTHYAKDAQSAVGVLDRAMKSEPSVSESVPSKRTPEQIARLQSGIHVYDAAAQAADAKRLTVTIFGERNDQDAGLLDSIARLSETGTPVRVLVPALGEEELPRGYEAHLGNTVPVIGVSPARTVAGHLTHYSVGVRNIELSGLAPDGGTDELYIYPHMIRSSNVIVVRDTLRPQDDYGLATAIHNPLAVVVFENADGPASHLYRDILARSGKNPDSGVFFGIDQLGYAVKDAERRMEEHPESSIPRAGG
jgi:hypothetical protein